MTATLNFSGSVARSTGHKLTGGLSFAGNIVRQIPKSIAAALSFTGGITGIKIATKALSGALSFSGSVTRTTGKALTAAANFSGAISRGVLKSLMPAGLTFYATNGLLFDGIQNYAKETTASLYTNFQLHDWSIAVWINPNISNGNYMISIIGQSGNNQCLHIFRDSSQKIHVHFYGDDITGSANVPANTATLLVITYNNTTRLRQSFINGVLDINNTASGNFNTSNASPFYIGDNANGFGSFHNWSGELGPFYIWDHVISSTDITNLQNGAVQTGGLLTDWLMNEGSGTILNDGSGNGHAATLNGSPLPTWISGGLLKQTDRPITAQLNPTAATTNRVAWSQGAFNTHWSHNLSSNVTITDNSLVAPDGTTTASQFTANANSAGTWTNPVFPANATVTVSVYIAYVSGGTTWQVGTDRANVRFNVQTGTFVAQSTSSGGVVIGYNVENIGGGWFRFEVTYNSPQTSAAFTIYDENGATSSTVGVWGAQSEVGSVATTYVPTTTTTAHGNDQLTKQTNKLLAAILSFSSVFTYLAEVIMTAALNMVGSTVKSTSRSIAAILSFVGGFTGTKFASFVQNLTATLSLTGNTVKYTPKSLVGVLNFDGSFLKRAGKVITAGLTFVGTHARMHIFYKVLTASLSFTGGMGKSIQKVFTSTLSFIGAQIRDYITVFLHPIDIAFVLFDSLLFTLKMPGALAFTVNKPITLNTTMNMPLPLEFTVITGANILITFVVVPVINVTVVVPAPLAFEISK
jgi:hypothetical protein